MWRDLAKFALLQVQLGEILFMLSVLKVEKVHKQEYKNKSL